MAGSIDGLVIGSIEHPEAVWCEAYKTRNVSLVAWLAMLRAEGWNIRLTLAPDFFGYILHAECSPRPLSFPGVRQAFTRRSDATAPVPAGVAG